MMEGTRPYAVAAVCVRQQLYSYFCAEHYSGALHADRGPCNHYSISTEIPANYNAIDHVAADLSQNTNLIDHRGNS